MQNEQFVNEHRRAFQQHKQGQPSGALHEILDQPDEPFPYLEKMTVVVKKHPYAAIGAMISIAAIVISAITVISVSIGGGMFLMYGEMNRNTALMQQILTKQEVIETRQLDDGKVMRAYEAANGKRIEFMVGLMTKEQQERMNNYDRIHPSPLMPLERKDQ